MGTSVERDMETDDFANRLGVALSKLEDKVDAIGSASKPANSTANTSSINVNAGGVGIWVCAWIASLCCVAMLVAGGMFLWSVSRQMEAQDAKIAKQDDQLSRMQDYLNAIYAAAPQLKPKDKE